MPVEQSSGELCAVAADQQVPSPRITHQRADACFVDGDIDWVEAAKDLIGNSARLFLASNSNVTAEVEPASKPRQKKDCGNRSAEF